MTWGEYLTYSAGQKRQRAEKWEQIRRLAFITASSMGGLGISETEFMPLPYDNEPDKLDDDSEIDIIEYQKQLIELHVNSR